MSKAGRPVKYRKLYNLYKKSYQKETEKLLKAGERPKEDLFTYRDFKTVLEGKRTGFIERTGTSPRRSRIITRITQTQIYGNYVSPSQLKEYKEYELEKTQRELEELKAMASQANQIVMNAKGQERLDAIEISAKYKDDIARKEEELKELRMATSSEMRLKLQDYLKDIYKDLKTKGYTSKEAGKWISQNVFGSD